MAAAYPVVLSVINVTGNVCTETYLQTVDSFSSMIPKCWRNTTYGWMSFKSRRLQLWTLLLWRSWTRWGCWVSCSERMVSHFIRLSRFLNRFFFVWDVGLQLEGGGLRLSHRTLYAPLQSRNLQNTVEGYRQYLAKLWQNLGRYQEHVFCFIVKTCFLLFSEYKLFQSYCDAFRR